jgi:hypothetical protein
VRLQNHPRDVRAGPKRRAGGAGRGRRRGATRDERGFERVFERAPRLDGAARASTPVRPLVLGDDPGRRSAGPVRPAGRRRRVHGDRERERGRVRRPVRLRPRRAVHDGVGALRRRRGGGARARQAAERQLDDADAARGRRRARGVRGGRLETPREPRARVRPPDDDPRTGRRRDGAPRRRPDRVEVVVAGGTGGGVARGGVSSRGLSGPAPGDVALRRDRARAAAQLAAFARVVDELARRDDDSWGGGGPTAGPRTGASARVPRERGERGDGGERGMEGMEGRLGRLGRLARLRARTSRTTTTRGTTPPPAPRRL